MTKETYWIQINIFNKTSHCSLFLFFYFCLPFFFFVCPFFFIYSFFYLLLLFTLQGFLKGTLSPIKHLPYFVTLLCSFPTQLFFLGESFYFHMCFVCFLRYLCVTFFFSFFFIFFHFFLFFSFFFHFFPFFFIFFHVFFCFYGIHGVSVSALFLLRTQNRIEAHILYARTFQTSET